MKKKKPNIRHSAPAVGVQRLVRRMRGGSFLDFDPPAFCECGGELEVRDYLSACSRSHASREMRYETYCPKCNTCDPNGYGSQADILCHGPEYFEPNALAQATAGAEPNQNTK